MKIINRRAIILSCFLYLILSNLVLECNSANIELAQVRGSSVQDFGTELFKIPLVNLELSDKEIKLYSDGGAATFSSSMESFLEQINDTKYVSIHYGMFKDCTSVIQMDKDGQPIVINLKNPIDSKEFFLELSFNSNQPDNVLPRNTIKDDISGKCTTKRNEMKAGLNELLLSSTKLSEKASTKQKVEKEEQNKIPAPTKQNTVQNNIELNDNLKTEMKNKENLEKQISSASSQSQDNLKSSTSCSAQIKEKEQKKIKLATEIGIYQAKIKDLEAKKIKIKSKAPLESDSNLQLNNNAVLATNEKKSEKKLADNKVSDVETQINELSQQILDLDNEIKDSNMKIDDQNKNLSSATKSRTSGEVANSEFKIRLTADQCTTSQAKLDQLNKKLTAKKQEVALLKAQIAEHLGNKATVEANHFIVKEGLKKSTLQMLDELEKCFVFGLGFINVAKSTFQRDSKEAINYLMSIRPNSNGYNMVNKLFTSMTPTVCGTFRAQVAKRRIQEKRKTRKEEKDKKLSSSSGQIFNGQDEGRRLNILPLPRSNDLKLRNNKDVLSAEDD